VILVVPANLQLVLPANQNWGAVFGSMVMGVRLWYDFCHWWDFSVSFCLTADFNTRQHGRSMADGFTNFPVSNHSTN
jgi:hypothetical protein